MLKERGRRRFLCIFNSSLDDKGSRFGQQVGFGQMSNFDKIWRDNGIINLAFQTNSEISFNEGKLNKNIII